MKANKNRKKIELRELVDPIKKFYRMNNSKEIYFMWVSVYFFDCWNDTIYTVQGECK